jgi:hypothetical protein
MCTDINSEHLMLTSFNLQLIRIIFTKYFGIPPRADMTRSKLRVVQSYDEYMTEEHDNTTHEDAESSDFQHLSCNGEEGLTDSDDEEDEDDHDHTGDDAQGSCLDTRY